MKHFLPRKRRNLTTTNGPPFVVRNSAMEKRRLQVLKWIGTVPAIGTCTLCNREFKVPVSAMKKVADAQENLTVQFTEHRCKEE
jgi:hypothetical protein